MKDSGLMKKVILDRRNKIGSFFERFTLFFRTSGKLTYASLGLMGLGQILAKQYIKGILLMLVEVAFIVFMALVGGKWFLGYFSLGQVQADPWSGIAGDNSVVFLILGILSFIIIGIFIAIYISQVKAAHNAEKTIANGRRPATFKEDMKSLIDKNFYKSMLVLPIVGVCIFSILPIIFMILIAFTNYGGDTVPPILVSWTGFESFIKVFTASGIASTFGKILVWNICWAFGSTFINYFLGLGLALLFNKTCVKGKVFWRMFPILAYAIPGFITLLGFKFMFSNGGPINYYIQQAGGESISFLIGADSKWSARMIGFFVNAWISVPNIMLLATGILSNMNKDLYEAASIDGAGKVRQFGKITLPFVIFSTTPVIISQFIGNFNNFGIFYFLRGGLKLDGYFYASDTDLLINWLYNLSINNNYYSIGAAISLIIFIFTSIFSLIAYITSPAYRKEDTYK